MQAGEPAVWQVRVLAGALGALCSGVAALVTSPTAIGLIVGLMGMPVGAVLGLFYGPELVAAEHTGPLLRGMAWLAAALGTVGFAMGYAISQSACASPAEILQFGYLSFFVFGIVGAGIGVPMSLIVGRTATFLGRRLAPKAATLWIPSAVVLVVVASGTAFALASAARTHGDLVMQAVQLGSGIDRVTRGCP